VTQTDPAGNRSDETTVTPVVDLTAPDAPEITTANADEIAGTAEPGSEVVVTTDDGKVLCDVKAEAVTGAWSCPTPDSVTEDTAITATATDPAGNVSGPGHGFLDVTDPVPPLVNPSNGSEISGTGEPGSVITIKDGNGHAIAGCESVTASVTDGKFLCTPDSRLPEGSVVTVTATDPHGNQSQPTRITVGIISIRLAHQARYPGEAQIVTGLNFNPGETVCLTVFPLGLDGGCRPADASGQVVFTVTLPSGSAAGAASASLTADKSGTVSAGFTVLQVEIKTGGQVAGGTSGTGLAAGLAIILIGVGLGLKRRREV
jgi:hypothetical protein